MKPGRIVASFDSMTGMLRALARFLSGRDSPLIGQLPGTLEPLFTALLAGVNHLPSQAADPIYAASGVAEAVPPQRIHEIRSEDLASWVVDHYPRQRYPAVFIGSSNGALIHLAAALGVPWLPQTLLIPVRRRDVDRDDAEGELRAGLRPGTSLLENNPDLRLHHMHDPNQDRLMIAGMSYFRVKWRRLPAAYRAFLEHCLQPGGTVISVECGLTWPTTRVADRHVFQFGALGGATASEYHGGGDRVADLLARYGSRWGAWRPPAVDTDSPEAEWGFDPELLTDLYDIAQRKHVRLGRLRFDHPERLSAAVADLYRQWYAERGLPSSRLLGECFLLLEPWWTLRTGSVPFWSVFNTEGSVRALNAYLDRSEPFDEIRLMLFSHGAESIGLAGIPDWQGLSDRARKVGTLLGVDRHAYPRDFASLARGHRELTRVRHLLPMPQPLSLSRAEELLRNRSEVQWSIVE